jgi:hypothetical protein
MGFIGSASWLLAWVKVLRHITVCGRKMSREKNLEISVNCRWFVAEMEERRYFSVQGFSGSEVRGVGVEAQRIPLKSRPRNAERGALNPKKKTPPFAGAGSYGW